MFYWKIPSVMNSLLLKNIFLARFFDLKVEELFRKGVIQKWSLSHIGQEAGPTALCTLLEKEDVLIPPYRGYAHVISKGLPLASLASEVLGRSFGPARGIGTRGNFISPDLGIYAGSVMLGSNFGVAVGMALALKKQGGRNMVTIFFGDGAATRPTFLSAVNLSVIWDLPILWVCENNQYSASTHDSETARTPLSHRVSAFGLRSHVIDGNDLYAVYRRGKRIIDRMRLQRKPEFIELATFRIAEHDFTFIPGNDYQDQRERERWLGRDPLRVLLGRKGNIFSMPKMHQAAIVVISETAEKEVGAAFDTALMHLPMTKEELLSSYEE